jgi:hypothetical protein
MYPTASKNPPITKGMKTHVLVRTSWYRWRMEKMKKTTENMAAAGSEGSYR